jgi:4-hydroxyacetophenone monooxygenase
MAAAVTPPFTAPVAPVGDDTDSIARQLDDADLPALLPALAYATGDLTLLRSELRPDPLASQLPQGGLSDDQQRSVRELALQELVDFRDGGSMPASPPGGGDLLAILEHTVGAQDMGAYLPMLMEELTTSASDPRAPSWHLAHLAPGRTLEVAVIGAGMSGLLAAHRLLQAGIEPVVFERSAEVGGTWHDNRYPGCRVDNPNHAYSYSFAQRHDWPHHFSTQATLFEYFNQFADHFGLRSRIRLRTEVLAAVWSDDAERWMLSTRTGAGPTESFGCDVVVSAVGQLNRPAYPDLVGLEQFAGEAFHSARWDEGVALTGRRVAVIGTGASAIQFIPEVAEDAGELLVFQRTPPWLGPTPDYHEAVAPGLQWLYRHLPGYSALNRFAMFWRLGDQALEAVRVDAGWEGGGRSVSAVNDFVREMLTGYLRSEFADRPDLLDAIIPSYPVGAKRILRDNGTWARTLKRPNVRLITTPIGSVSEGSISTTDGVEHPVDVIIYGTGFRASEFLTPMKVLRRGGVDLHDLWGDDARAYLGVTVPHFPNFFCLYGPNTNIVVNGSIIYFSECGARYILGCLGHLVRQASHTIEVRSDVHDEFNRRVDEQNSAMAWGASDVNSWYKNHSGRVTQNWPFTLLEYWERTLEPNPDDYLLA